MGNFFRPVCIALFLCLATLLGWPLCRPAAQEKADYSDANLDPRYGGVYRAPLLNNPSTLDPHHAQDIYAVPLIQQIFDGLVKFSPDLFVVPALAENWRVEEGGKAYRFFLRKNARFHNGRSVTSNDVIFSFCRMLRTKPALFILPHLLKISGARNYAEYKSEEVPGLERVDDYTLIIRLDQAYVPFLLALGMYQAKVVPTEEVMKREGRFAQEPIGSGPFKFVSWQSDKVIQLESFQNYYGGRPFLEGIEYIIYPGIQIEQVWADFQKGKLEEMPAYGQVLAYLQGRNDLSWIHRPSLSLMFYGINCKHPRMKNPELRRALSLAIDRKALVSKVYHNQVEAAESILPPGLPGYHPIKHESRKDIDTVLHQFMLTKEGKPEELEPIEIVSNSQSSTAKSELEFVRKSWARLGIAMKPKFIPNWSQFEDYLKSESMQIFRYAWFADIPDPDDFLRPLFSSSSQFNYMNYESEGVDLNLQEAPGLVDPLQRAEMYSNIESMILESYPIIPLLYPSVDYVYQPTVQGIHVSALGAQTMSFLRIWLKPTDP